VNLFPRRETEGHSYFHPWSLEGMFIPSRGQNSPLGDNFAPGVKVCTPGAKLRMGLYLCSVFIFFVVTYQNGSKYTN
jgi:hypothetical protein